MDQTETYRRVWSDCEFPMVTYGLPYPQACGEHIKKDLGASRIYIVFSKSLANNGDHVQRLKDTIGRELVVGIRVGMKPNSLYSEIIEIARELQALEADCLVTIGGGSLIDGGKAAILAVANEAYTMETLQKVLTRSMLSSQGSTVKGSTIPMVSIPTTLSGGEYNSYGACTSDSTLSKSIYSNPTHEPRLVVVDSNLALTTPARVWISTGVRAIDHCVEALCSSNLSKDAETNFMQGLRLLIPGLLACVKNPVDAEARRKCQLGGMNSMKFMTLKVLLGASHGIGRQLGPYGVPHGETSCVLMPAVAAFNVKVNAPQQARIMESLWSDEAVRDVFERNDLTKESASLANALDAIIRELGMPRDLRTVGVGSESLEQIAESCLKDPFCKSNPVPLLEKEQVLEILGTVLENKRSM